MHMFSTIIINITCIGYFLEDIYSTHNKGFVEIIIKWKYIEWFGS